MRAVVQTVSRAAVRVDGETVGQVEDGLLVLVGVTHGDTVGTAQALARKVYGLRILPGESAGLAAGERAASDVGAPVLVVSQFTLYGDVARGRRPSWGAAAPAEVAEPLVAAYVEATRGLGARVETGRFGAHMLVESVNIGPCTLIVDMH